MCPLLILDFGVPALLFHLFYIICVGSTNWYSLGFKLFAGDDIPIKS